MKEEVTMFENVVIGSPLVDAKVLLSAGDEDWEKNEKAKTLFTQTRFLPAVLKEAGVVNSTSEVRRNRPELVRNLDALDCFMLKWGKKRVFIVVGN